VHRIGRTGRAGRSGQAISFVTPRETYLLRSIEKANRTTLEAMNLPTVEDVNAFRVAKFTDAIGQALSDPQLGIFRELVQSYEQEHDVPAEDIAAAIAVLAQDGEPLFLEDMPEPAPSERRERREPASGLVRWRISVGKRHRVEPRQIVGALANEGGLRRADFGRIDIKPGFSLVELPADLSPETLGKLSDTRISGVLIDLQLDKGPAPRSGGPKRSFEQRGSRPPGKKPRHKHG
jgi:ATP-dependent RNA helicase DeaD